MTEGAGGLGPLGRRLGPLGRRLVVAFSVVALAAVVLMALAAQQAVSRGVRVASESGQDAVAARVADEVSAAVVGAGGWVGADLSGALEVATGAGFSATVRDDAGEVVASTTPGRGAHNGGMGMEMEMGGATVTVAVADRVVGTVWVGMRGAGAGAAMTHAQERGLEVAWPWVAGAALAALALAVVAGWFVTRWLTAPLAHLAGVARAFAQGEPGVRADEAGAGEIGELARGFNEAADAVESSAAARRQMAADVAHELRTPLSALQAALEELRDGYVPADRDTLARLHDQTVRLGRVVGDLALLGQPGDAVAQVGRARLDLGALVADELAARTPELRAAGLVVGGAVGAGTFVVGDAGRLHQAVGNVLANCARHCGPGDRVNVDVGLDGTGRRAMVVVADSGPGIAPEDRERAFERYWRGPARGVEGSGIGLAVVREIVAAHRGEARVTETPGGGATVTLALPAALTPPGPEADAER